MIAVISPLIETSLKYYVLNSS